MMTNSERAERGEAAVELTTIIRPTWDDTVHAALQRGPR